MPDTDRLLSALDAFLAQGPRPPIEVRAPGPVLRFASDVPSWKLIQKIAAKTEPKLSRAVLKAIAATLQGSDRDAVEAALNRDDIDGAVDAIQWDALGTPIVQADLLGAFADAFNAAGKLAVKVVSVDDPGDFAVTDPRALEWIQVHGGELVTNLGDKAPLRASLESMLTDGLTPEEAAKSIFNVVGLTDRYQAAVDRYRGDLLDANDPRALAKADKYAVELRMARSRMIGRTEAQYAVWGGQDEAWGQLADREVIDRNSTEERWLTAEDEQVDEDECAPMDGQTVPLGEMFTTGTGKQVKAPPEPHPGCRCSKDLVLH